MRRSTPTITSLPPAPADERAGRMLKYTIAMVIRVICIALCLVVPGWWVVIPVLGAVFLPYFAVLIANAGTATGGHVETPGALPLPAPPAGGEPRT